MTLSPPCTSYHAQVALHFVSLESEGCEALTYMNHEGVPEKEAVGDYFQEVTLFRRHHFCTPLKPEAREAMAFWSQRTGHGQYLLVYDCGKSVAKVMMVMKYFRIIRALWCYRFDLSIVLTCLRLRNFLTIWAPMRVLRGAPTVHAFAYAHRFNQACVQRRCTLGPCRRKSIHGQSNISHRNVSDTKGSHGPALPWPTHERSTWRRCDWPSGRASCTTRAVGSAGFPLSECA